jgi:hypothetical protein
MRARFLAGVGLVGLVAALSLASAASADTATIGAAAPGALGGTTANFVIIQSTTDPASPSYVVPQIPGGAGPWSVTSWGARGGAGEGSASLEIWRPTSTSGEFRLIAIGPEQAFPAGVVTSHSVNVPVLPGDHLGLVTGPDGDFRPQYTTGLTGDVWLDPHGSPVVGQTTGAPSSDFFPVSSGTDVRVNMQATLTSAPAVAAPAPTTTTPTRKCHKKKEHKRSAESAKKKCKKHKKK